MIVRSRSVVPSALALASLIALSPIASATEALTPYHPVHRPVRHVVHRPVNNGDIYIQKGARNYLTIGAVKDVGSTNRYFSDTSGAPQYYPLGPGFAGDRGGFENLPSARPPF